jgi:hypothetical protein
MHYCIIKYTEFCGARKAFGLLMEANSDVDIVMPLYRRESGGNRGVSRRRQPATATYELALATMANARTPVRTVE